MNESHRFLDRLWQYSQKEDVQGRFESFFKANCHHFDDSEEHKLQYTALYEEFQSLFETVLQEFLDAEGMDQATFYEKAKSIESGDDGVARHFLSVVVAGAEYGPFVEIMRDMRREQDSRLGEREPGVRHGRDEYKDGEELQEMKHSGK
mmetsp:Transcript_14920/g.47559  ORF Transcript_14920/g.47559 Transcript_14920/m.47559 type:complete len:149 (+) Transcript_14920:7-453(+)|eukprot:CAMPEP_0196781082 /NCGR_PEP_ID=MMETSP1104-20130614/9042_1 /TAXON_ID=33652 /ORGANISM="Cafeteria sp., Strain Caron Lab Isolate" /LENGTH=148 /DNA_ID=CAMNT_0042151303 /DNA_START=3 /DNA_END=449 /DNA_ORIENTATION=+